MTAQEDRQEEQYALCLQRMQELISEMEMGIKALKCNSVKELNQHVARQQELCSALAASGILEGDWANKLSRVPDDSWGTALTSVMQNTADTIRNLNLQYSLLVKQSTKTANMLLALYRYHSNTSGNSRTQLSYKV
jgi:molybdopterin-biosynthesis enzyme MoeA-like protein